MPIALRCSIIDRSSAARSASAAFVIALGLIFPCLLGVAPGARADEGTNPPVAFQFDPGSGGAVGTRGETFRTLDVHVQYVDGQSVVLAGDPTGRLSTCPPEDEYCGNVWVDDAMDMVVTHADGTQSTWSNEWTFSCFGLYPSAPIDLSGLFADGDNVAHISLRDECGAREGSSPLYFIGDAAFVQPPAAGDTATETPGPSAPATGGTTPAVPVPGDGETLPAPAQDTSTVALPTNPERDAVVASYDAPPAPGEVVLRADGPVAPGHDGIVLTRFFIPGRHAAGGLLLGDGRNFLNDVEASYRAALMWNTRTGRVVLRITKSCQATYKPDLPADVRDWLAKPGCRKALTLRGVPREEVWKHADTKRSTNLVHLYRNTGSRLQVRLSILNSYTNSMPGGTGAWSVDDDLTISPSSTTPSGFSMSMTGNGYPAIESVFYPDFGSPSVRTIAHRAIQNPRPHASGQIGGYVGAVAGGFVGATALGRIDPVGAIAGVWVGKKVGKKAGETADKPADGGGGDAALDVLSWAMCDTDAAGTSMECKALHKGDPAHWTTPWTP